MKQHGILMKGEMVRAYLAGSKWMTRRMRNLDAINKNPNDWKLISVSEKGAFFTSISNPQLSAWSKLPYGWVGDMLWFKETWAAICRQADPFCICETEEEMAVNHYIEYRADTNHAYPGDWPEDEARGNDEAPKWRSSMFMPRKYSRICVPVVRVRVERVQDITLGDVAGEGWPDAPKTQEVWVAELPNAWKTGFPWYHKLWDSINAKRGLGWEVNPWMWVYEFPKYSKLQENTICSLGYDMAKG